MSAGEAQILVRLGADTEIRISALRLRDEEQPSVTIAIPLEGGSLVSVTASAYRFRELVRQLREFEESLPGRPS